MTRCGVYFLHIENVLFQWAIGWKFLICDAKFSSLLALHLFKMSSAKNCWIVWFFDDIRRPYYVRSHHFWVTLYFVVSCVVVCPVLCQLSLKRNFLTSSFNGSIILWHCVYLYWRCFKFGQSTLCTQLIMMHIYEGNRSKIKSGWWIEAFFRYSVNRLGCCVARWCVRLFVQNLADDARCCFLWLGEYSSSFLLTFL